MKKILMGLVAISATSLAAFQLDKPQANTNVFEFGGQEGKIKVSATFKSYIAPVKYVVFADADGTWSGTDEEDIWTLPEILLSQKTELNVIDTATALKNVYVKKVSQGDVGVEEIDTTKNVNFKVVLDSSYTSIAGQPFKSAGEYIAPITALMSRTDLEGLIVGLTNASVNTSGEIEKDSKIYRNPKKVRFYSDTNGVLKVELAPNSAFSETSTMPLAQAKEVEALFSTSKAYNNVRVEVTVQ